MWIISGASTITTGIELPGTTNQLSSLIMNKIGMATVTLDKNVTVNGALTLTGGSLITTAAFRIFVAATGTSTGSAASFVIGTIQKTFGNHPIRHLGMRPRNGVWSHSERPVGRRQQHVCLFRRNHERLFAGDDQCR
ncbi:MAG: hypothetical protein IPG58_17475 [Acidobacteria bacterium]|nr:hypothetical protein [Acidobacteriota bacterium]